MEADPNMRTPRSLATLPSEIRRLIVACLAPHPDQLERGCKRDLQNANVAHRCLHEWATEYMFRDMALQHVLVGMSSQLELFGLTQDNRGLLKYVKHIRVMVRFYWGPLSPLLTIAGSSRPTMGNR